ncbi:MAG: site-specific DNA-methyltransferase [Actinomycetota bacterium]|nr:site-specific DNA-methyltransferase [Actinomycetota bacterium]
MINLDSGDSWVVTGTAQETLNNLDERVLDLIYIDPPFNTGITQTKTTTKSRQTLEEDGVTGFGGKKYLRETVDAVGYSDSHEDFIESFLKPVIDLSHSRLKDHGALYLHLDYREVHYAKVLLDSIFGRDNFLNEIIWAYDYGGKAKTRWPAKHDNILFYVKDRKNYKFNTDQIDREPYMAPGLVTKEKAERGKLPTDVWWHTIVSPTGHEKSGYPNQKPLGILRRILGASSDAGDIVADFFSGSGTTAVAANEMGRRFIVSDINPKAIEVTSNRLENIGAQFRALQL